VTMAVSTTAISTSCLLAIPTERLIRARTGTSPAAISVHGRGHPVVLIGVHGRVAFRDPISESGTLASRVLYQGAIIVAGRGLASACQMNFDRLRCCGDVEHVRKWPSDRSGMESFTGARKRSAIVELSERLAPLIACPPASLMPSDSCVPRQQDVSPRRGPELPRSPVRNRTVSCSPRYWKILRAGCLRPGGAPSAARSFARRSARPTSARARPRRVFLVGGSSARTATSADMSDRASCRGARGERPARYRTRTAPGDIDVSTRDKPGPVRPPCEWPITITFV